MLVGWILALGTACTSTGDNRPMVVDSWGESSTGGEPNLTVGSLVTGIGDTSDHPGDAESSTEGSGGSTSGDTGPDDSSSSEDTTTGEPSGLPEYCEDPIPAAGDDPLIDDLELEPGQMLPDERLPEIDGRVGYWFTYNDESPGGMQTPLPGQFQPAMGGAAGSDYSAATLGEGFSAWGAGMGVKLNNDFTGDCPYDLTSYDGITFEARGNVTARLSITTRATHPIEGGGTCDPERGQCSDHFGMALVLEPNWKVFTIAWADLVQQGWGLPAQFDPGQIIEIQWQAPPMVPFEIYVDELNLWQE